jgi:heat shock protein HtpX
MPLGLVLTMTFTLFLLFGFLFGLLAVVGLYFNLNAYLVVGIAIGMVIVQWLIGPSIIKWTTNMREMNPKEYPWVRGFVAELCKKHKLKMPKIFIVNDGNPNAFVFGLTNSSANLCVTQGLMQRLTKEEVKGVLAHEVGHIKNNDMVLMVIISAVPIIAFFVARFLIFAPREGDRRDTGYLVLVGLAAYVIYFVTNLLTLLFSRVREYYADNFGGKNFHPHHLASALAKITYGLGLSKAEFKNSTLNHFYIADPFTSHYEISHFSSEFSDMHISKDEIRKAIEWEKKNVFARIGEWFRTHPLTWKRIRALHQLEIELGGKNK